MSSAGSRAGELVEGVRDSSWGVGVGCERGGGLWLGIWVGGEGDPKLGRSTGLGLGDGGGRGAWVWGGGREGGGSKRAGKVEWEGMKGWERGGGFVLSE